MWEKSITICNKMLAIIQDRLFNYEEASCILEWKSRFFTNVYNDDRKFSMEELSQLAGVSLEEAKRILEFTESNSNSHSAWLTFMYPRLYIARELLKEKA